MEISEEVKKMSREQLIRVQQKITQQYISGKVNKEDYMRADIKLENLLRKKR